MPIDLTLSQLLALLKELCSLPKETEWVEFKRNADIKVIGEYISALSNSAALIGKKVLTWCLELTTIRTRLWAPSLSLHRKNISSKKLRIGCCKNYSPRSTSAFMSLWRERRKTYLL